MKRTPIDYAWAATQLMAMAWIFSMLGLTCYAQSVCGPRMGGSWTFSAGVVCDGEAAP